jgi:hypothetical protein
MAIIVRHQPSPPAEIAAGSPPADSRGAESWWGRQVIFTHTDGDDYLPSVPSLRVHLSSSRDDEEPVTYSAYLTPNDAHKLATALVEWAQATTPDLGE